MSKILSGELAIVNQLRPSRHPWAWELFLKGQANNWSPAEISMAKDIQQWRDPKGFTDDERLLVRRCLGFFAGSESLVANNLLLGIFRAIGDAECRQYILRQAYEEALHNHTIVYICDSLNLDIKEVYEAYRTIPSIKAKDDFLMSITTDMGRSGFRIPPMPSSSFDLSNYARDENGEFGYDYARDVATYLGARWPAVQARQEVLRNLITYYVVCEGIFFYSGFAMLLAFGRQSRLPGVCEQIQYSIRDESIHVQFGVRLINTIIEQEPEAWTEKFQKETMDHIRKATELEIAYARDVLPRGILGLNAAQFVDYMGFIANRRLGMLGLPEMFPDAKNPFPWLAETIDLAKQKNFFETKVTEYSSGGLVDDMD